VKGRKNTNQYTRLGKISGKGCWGGKNPGETKKRRVRTTGGPEEEKKKSDQAHSSIGFWIS